MSSNSPASERHGGATAHHGGRCIGTPNADINQTDGLAGRQNSGADGTVPDLERQAGSPSPDPTTANRQHPRPGSPGREGASASKRVRLTAESCCPCSVNSTCKLTCPCAKSHRHCINCQSPKCVNTAELRRLRQAGTKKLSNFFSASQTSCQQINNNLRDSQESSETAAVAAADSEATLTDSQETQTQEYETGSTEQMTTQVDRTSTSTPPHATTIATGIAATSQGDSSLESLTQQSFGGQSSSPDDDASEDSSVAQFAIGNMLHSPTPTPPLPTQQSQNVGASEGSQDSDYTLGEKVDEEYQARVSMASTALQKLEVVYGRKFRLADMGLRETGGVEPPIDRFWQESWKRLVVRPAKHYRVPGGRVGRDFIKELVEEFRGVRSRRWNSEKVLCFIICVLTKSPCSNNKSASEIRQRISSRLAQWKNKEFDSLIDATEADIAQGLSGKGPPASQDAKARAFDAAVKAGYLAKATANLTRSSEGGVLALDDIDAKSGKTVLQVLRDKHPKLRDVDCKEEGVFEFYPKCPKHTPLEIKDGQIEKVAQVMRGGGGPSGVNAVELQGWLLRHGHQSSQLRFEMAAWTEWLANTDVPWAAIRGIMACRSVPLDKCPGVRPVGIGEVFRRLWAKAMLAECRMQATLACGSSNLCAGLPAGIEAACHAAIDRYEELFDKEIGDGAGEAHSAQSAAATGRAEHRDPRNLSPDSDDDSVVDLGDANGNGAGVSPDNPHAALLIDAENGFNMMARIPMLWTVRHLWARGHKFVANCYQNAARLVVRCASTGRCTFLSLEEGVAQGDPISMICYGITMVPLQQALANEVPSLLNEWYADDSLLMGKCSDLDTGMAALMRMGPPRGYIPQPRKSFLVAPKAHHPPALEILGHYDFQVSTGERYVGGFLGDSTKRTEWINTQIQEFVHGVKTLAHAARRYPQSAYAALTRCWMPKWNYVQRCCRDIGPAFQPVEKALAEEFLPALFQLSPAEVAPLRGLLALPVGKGGLGVPDPTTVAEDGYHASRLGTKPVITALLNNEELDVGAYIKSSASIRDALKESRAKDHQAAFKALVEPMPDPMKRVIKRAPDNGCWLSVVPSLINGTVLTSDEFRDSLWMRFNKTPRHLPRMCDACDCPFDVRHALKCARGGLIHRRHDLVKKVWIDLCGSAFGSNNVTDEPLIHHSRAELNEPAAATGPANSNREGERGDVGVVGFYNDHRLAIFDVRITDVDGASNTRSKRSPQACLLNHEKQKFKSYGDACAQLRRDFVPLVFSADGLHGKHATAAVKRLAALLAKSWGTAYPVTCGYIRSRISLSLARSLTMCLRDPRDPTSTATAMTPVVDAASLSALHV